MSYPLAVFVHNRSNAQTPALELNEQFSCSEQAERELAALIDQGFLRGKAYSLPGKARFGRRVVSRFFEEFSRRGR